MEVAAGLVCRVEQIGNRSERSDLRSFAPLAVVSILLIAVSSLGVATISHPPAGNPDEIAVSYSGAPVLIVTEGHHRVTRQTKSVAMAFPRTEQERDADFTAPNEGVGSYEFRMSRTGAGGADIATSQSNVRVQLEPVNPIATAAPSPRLARPRRPIGAHLLGRRRP